MAFFIRLLGVWVSIVAGFVASFPALGIMSVEWTTPVCMLLGAIGCGLVNVGWYDDYV